MIIVNNETFQAMNNAGMVSIDMSGIPKFRPTMEPIFIRDDCNPENPFLLTQEQHESLEGNDADLDKILKFGLLELRRYNNLVQLIGQQVVGIVHDEITTRLRVLRTSQT